MQPVGPYRFTEALGVCQVGTAWWAVDGQDRLVTVAILDGAAAADQPWRDAFAAAANAMALAQGGQRYVSADFTAAKPWVAYPSEEGMGVQRLFQDLGMDLHPMESAAEILIPETGTIAEPPESVSGVPASGASSPTSGVPLPWAMHAAVSQPVSSPPESGDPQSVAVPPPDPVASPGRRITPSAPPRRRARVLVLVLALVLVMAVTGAGTFLWARSGAPGAPEAGPSAGSSLAPEPAVSPQSPGIEPPRAGEWPDDWPSFGPGDTVRTYADLEGLGFTLKVPTGWDCAPAGRAQGFAKYHCGVSDGKQQIGGELIVRDCPAPCDPQRRTSMRQNEDAWGLQWMRGGVFVSYANSSDLQIDGERRYGLVFVAYWRGGSSGHVDRQLVFRMTSTVDGIGQLRRVANYLRGTLIF
ncbi:hypothetical protein [Micromonospora sp. NPDC006431]|uniref:hypothetical protein n=1 Tax=Micromonospora sp. NPDC006431 TaxID=3364235 RepID=UPI0036C1AC5C